MGRGSFAGHVLLRDGLSTLKKCIEEAKELTVAGKRMAKERRQRLEILQSAYIEGGKFYEMSLTPQWDTNNSHLRCSANYRYKY